MPASKSPSLRPSVVERRAAPSDRRPTPGRGTPATRGAGRCRARTSTSSAGRRRTAGEDLAPADRVGHAGDLARPDDVQVLEVRQRRDARARRRSACRRACDRSAPCRSTTGPSNCCRNAADTRRGPARDVNRRRLQRQPRRRFGHARSRCRAARRARRRSTLRSSRRSSARRTARRRRCECSSMRNT